jgi:hypothetical protein
MAAKSEFFQAGFFADVLRSAALAIALIAQASLAHAAPVTLSCRSETNSQTWTFRIDYATGLVEQLNSNGDAYKNRVATATISPNAIVWSIDQPYSYRTGDGVTHQTTEHWAGHIDRLSATGWVRSYDDDHYRNLPVDITCRQATQKF